MNKNLYWVIPLVLIIGAGMFFLLNPTKMSTISGTDYHVQYDVGCKSNAECMSFLIGQGMPQDMTNQVLAICEVSTGKCDVEWSEQ